jgi:peptidoglycan/LPS O-acetylase OafA/YrhL
MRNVTVVCFAVSATMFGLGYELGIFRASRLLGFTLRETALNLLFAGVIGLALLIGTSRWKAVVNRPVLRFFGEISYGVYLIHMLIFDLVNHFLTRVSPPSYAVGGSFSLMLLRFTIAGGLTVAVAYLSRWYFEEPFLRMKGRLDGDRPKVESALANSY